MKPASPTDTESVKVTYEEIDAILPLLPALKKAEGQRCQHQCDTGCAIYADRPDDCRGFECGWICGQCDEELRPDKFELMFTKSQPHKDE